LFAGAAARVQDAGKERQLLDPACPG
jgi:hypothetical protein